MNEKHFNKEIKAKQIAFNCLHKSDEADEREKEKKRRILIIRRHEINSCK